MEEQTLKINVSQGEEKEKPKYDDWEIKCAVDTLVKAEEIRNDSELMAFVAPELEKRAKATKTAAEILYGNDNKENK
jgi:hypothetical protein